MWNINRKLLLLLFRPIVFSLTWAFGLPTFWFLVTQVVPDLKTKKQIEIKKVKNRKTPDTKHVENLRNMESPNLRIRGIEEGKEAHIKDQESIFKKL